MGRKTESRMYPQRSKKKTNKRKANRLMNEAKRNKLQKEYKSRRADLNIIMVRGDEELVLGVRRGLFGHPNAPILRVTDDQIVGAIENPAELGDLCVKLGMLAFSQLVGHNIAFGPDGLPKAMAKWAKIDLEALKKASDAELLAEAARVKELADLEPADGAFAYSPSMDNDEGMGPLSDHDDEPYGGGV